MERSFVKIIKIHLFLILFVLCFIQIPVLTLSKRECPGGFCSPCSSGCPITVTCSSTGGGGGGTGTCGNCADFCCINISSTQTVSSLVATCASIENNLTVFGTVDIKGNLIQESDATFKEDVCIGGNLSVAGDEIVGGKETIEGPLTVNNSVLINGTTTINGPVFIFGNQSVSQNEVIGGQLIVDGTGIINGLLTANNGLLVNGGETINTGGLVILNGGASITGDVIISQTLATNDLEVLGDLTVDQNSFFNGCNTVVNGTLITNGPVIMNRGLTVASGDQIISTGNLTLNTGDLTVGGFSTFNGPVIAQNGATIENGLTVFGGETVASGNLVVAPCGNADVGGSLTVTSEINSPSHATLSSLLITDLTNSTSPETGALVVNGGIGIAQDLWIGGSQFFQEVTRQGGIPSPLNYYEETCAAMNFEFATSNNIVTIQVVRIGNLVNLLIPMMIFGSGVDTVHSVTTLPPRFAPSCVVRGAASTIINDESQLGEFEVRPDGTIIFGLPGSLLSPQAFTATNSAQVDINTITYNRLNCGCNIG